MSVASSPVASTPVAAIADSETFNFSVASTLISSDFAIATSDPFTSLIMDETVQLVHAMEIEFFHIGETVWSPANLGDALRLWLDASDSNTITVTGLGVSQWSDKSGWNNHATQTTDADRPSVATAIQNGLNALRFDAANSEWMILPDFVSSFSAGSMVAIAKLDNDPPPGPGNSDTGPILKVGPDSTNTHELWTDGNSYDNFGTTVRQDNISITPSLASWYLRANRAAANDWELYINGTSARSSGTNTVAWTTTPHIAETGGGFVLNGHIGEIIVTNTALSTADRQKAEGYLAHKWGITSVLGVSHPYKTTAPQSASGESGVSHVHYAATRDFLTRATDTPANTPFLGTMLTPIRIDQSIVGGVGFGGFSVNWGEIEITNADADYDEILLNHVADGRSLMLKLGEIIGRTVQPYASFFTVSELTVDNIFIGDVNMRVSVRDNSYLLEIPSLTQIYLGTGDLEGTQDLKGKRKPWVLGIVSNITPAPVVPSELVYQVSHRPIQAVDAVYDGGLPLTSSGNYATSIDLRGATNIPLGFYGTCLAEGLIRLGAAPAKNVTCDIQGENTGGFITSTASIVQRILTATGSLAVDQISTGSIATLDAEQPAPIGYYLSTDTNETVAEIVRKLLAGIGAWGGFDRLGRFYVRRFTQPDIVPKAFYDETYFVSFQREPLPASVDPPPKRWRIIWDRNWTVTTDLVEGLIELDPDLATEFGQPYHLVTTPESVIDAIVAAHPRAQDPAPIESYFVLQGDAEAEEIRLRALYSDVSAVRSLYRVKVKSRVFLHRVGDTISISYPRLGLSSGVLGKIVEVKDDNEANETELLIFV